MKTKHDDISIAQMYTKLGSYEAVSQALRVPETSVRRAVKRVQETPLGDRTKDQELAILRGQVKNLEARAMTDAQVKKEILKVAAGEVTVPKWTLPPIKAASGLTGVPTLFASDWHFSEVVRAAEIGGVNEYNIAIAKERVKTMIAITIELLRKHLANGKYPGIVFVLGGDMLSGDIHEELQQTNEVETMPALLELVGVLSWCITTLADEFGHVFIPCVTGNHGRTTRKPRAKRRNHTNFDWLLYNILAGRFAADKRVQFLIPEGPDAYYKIYNTRYLLTHGDQFRGGDGMIGALGPIARGDKKKRSRNGQTDRNFDVMILGHWHQYIHMNRFIVNGTLKGYDEYADASNFDVEPAQQALWITHPDHGITFRAPVLVQRSLSVAKTEWVSLPKVAA